MRLGFRVLGLRYQMEKTKEPTATAAPRGGRGAGGGGRAGGWMDGWMDGWRMGQPISAFIQQKTVPKLTKEYQSHPVLEI